MERNRKRFQRIPPAPFFISGINMNSSHRRTCDDFRHKPLNINQKQTVSRYRFCWKLYFGVIVDNKLHFPWHSEAVCRKRASSVCPAWGNCPSFTSTSSSWSCSPELMLNLSWPSLFYASLVTSTPSAKIHLAEQWKRNIHIWGVQQCTLSVLFYIQIVKKAKG